MAERRGGRWRVAVGGRAVEQQRTMPSTKKRPPPDDSGAVDSGAPEDDSLVRARQRRCLEETPPKFTAEAEAEPNATSPPEQAEAAHVEAAPVVFLPCHLAMLKSLYKMEGISKDSAIGSDESTEADISEEDSPVEEGTWEAIQQFLGKREELRRLRDGARRWDGIREEAQGVDLICFQNYKQDGNGQREQKVGMFSPVRADRQKLMSSQGGSFRGGGGGTGFLSPAPAVSPQRRGCAPHLDVESSSWALMTKLVGRRRDAATKRAARAAEEFAPLAEAVNARLRGLRESLEKSVRSRISESGKPRLDMGGGKVERIAKMESKLRLWYLLSLSLKDCVATK